MCSYVIHGSSKWKQQEKHISLFDMPYKVLYSSSKLRQTQKRGVCHVLSLFIFADYPREIKFIVHVFYANLTYQDGNQKPIEVK